MFVLYSIQQDDSVPCSSLYRRPHYIYVHHRLDCRLNAVGYYNFSKRHPFRQKCCGQCKSQSPQMLVRHQWDKLCDADGK